MRVQKKSVMGEIISVFVMILVVSILAGLTFLFVGQLKTQSVGVSINADLNVVNESVTFSVTNVAQKLSSTRTNAICNAITYIANETVTGASLALGNITQTNCNVINTTGMGLAGTGNNRTVYVSYNVDYTDPNLPSAYAATNATESAGYTVIGYLPLIFLAVIFGAILVLVLKIILPFINLGKQVGGF
jgi:hypothetical protein